MRACKDVIYVLVQKRVLVKPDRLFQFTHVRVPKGTYTHAHSHTHTHACMDIPGAAFGANGGTGFGRRDRVTSIVLDAEISDVDVDAFREVVAGALHRLVAAIWTWFDPPSNLTRLRQGYNGGIRLVFAYSDICVHTCVRTIE